MKTKLDEFVVAQGKALNVLYEGQHVLPFLMVLYATIDIFGYITDMVGERRPGKRFRAFVDKYMAKHLENVDSRDLWGARCALLHTGTPESEVSGARQLVCSWKSLDDSLASDVVKESGSPDKYVAVAVETLCHSLVAGLHDFAEETKTDHALRESCLDRAKKFYSQVGI